MNVAVMRGRGGEKDVAVSRGWGGGLNECGSFEGVGVGGKKNHIIVSAPGKLMLFGDHAVVYDRPCIVSAVNHRMKVYITKRGDDKVILNAPDVNLYNYNISIDKLNSEHPKQAKFVLRAVYNFFDKFDISYGLDIETKSDFSSKFGLGSSSAVTVSVLKGLSELFDIHLDNKTLFDLAYKTVLDIQKVGSGFDVAAAIYGGILYFIGGGKKIERLKDAKIPLIVGYTGIKADTATLIKNVRRLFEENPKEISKIFDEIANIVDRSKIFIEKQEWKEVGKLMNDNQDLLRKLNVSSPELEKLIKASLDGGAYGAKLSGAGGGDCMIAVYEDIELIKNEIRKVGGIPLDVEIDYDGVRIELE
jgi:mevalonate kinase